MCASVHEIYREPLTALADDRTIAVAISEAGARHGWWTADRNWTRMYARFDPQNEVFATFVFESRDASQAICSVDAFKSRPPARDGEELQPFGDSIGWLRLAPFPSDPALPGLAAALASPGRATVVRYRPSRRCTIRVDDNRQTSFLKVYPNQRGERVHAESVALWRAARAGHLGFVVAEPDRWDSDTQTVWQRAIEGEPIGRRLSGSGGPDLAFRMGRAAGSLACAPLSPRERLDGQAALARSERHATELAGRVPSLQVDIDVVMGALRQFHAAAPARKPRPIHGALHPGQWLDDGAMLGLVDFDRFALGDPEADAGTLDADLEALGEAAPTRERLRAEFLAGYESIAGSLDPRLLGAYRLHQQLAKARRSARAVTPDGDRRAAKDLAKATRCLEDELR